MADPDIDDVAFALTPATHIVGLLNFAKTEHHKIYKSAIRAVDTAYNCEPSGLFRFLREVRDRSIQMGWMDGILSVNISEIEGEEELSNIIKNYGTLTLGQVTRWERRYIATPSRAAQDTYMLYQCLMASLTPEAREKIMIWADQYSIEVGGNSYDSGVALLKVIIRESHLDTNATTNSIRTKLSSLDSYIATVNFDIGKFNQYVKSLIQSLAARNQTTSDLLINLFKGYAAVSDQAFRTWLQRKRDDHEEKDMITPDELMLAAKNKYDSMIEEGIWNAPTAEEKIVALEAKLTSSMKTLNKRVSFEMTKKKGGKKTAATSKGGTAKHHKGREKGDHPKTWPKPKSGDQKEAEYKGYKWYWCGKDTGGKCECWRAHDPKECLGGAANANKEDKEKFKGKGKRQSPPDKRKKKEFGDKRLKIAKAYVAKLEQSGSGSDEESE
jgi:hypothetical protein